MYLNRLLPNSVCSGGNFYNKCMGYRSLEHVNNCTVNLCVLGDIREHHKETLKKNFFKENKLISIQVSSQEDIDLLQDQKISYNYLVVRKVLAVPLWLTCYGAPLLLSFTNKRFKKENLKNSRIFNSPYIVLETFESTSDEVLEGFKGANCIVRVGNNGERTFHDF